MLKKNVLFVLLCGGILLIPLLSNARNQPGHWIPWMQMGPGLGSGGFNACGNTCLMSHSVEYMLGCGCPSDYCELWNDCTNCGVGRDQWCEYGHCWTLVRFDDTKGCSGGGY